MLRDKIAHKLITLVMKYVASEWYESNTALYVVTGMIVAAQHADVSLERKQQAWVITDGMRRQAIKLCLSKDEKVVWDDGKEEKGLAFGVS